jgi:hypothetical protein
MDIVKSIVPIFFGLSLMTGCNSTGDNIENTKITVSEVKPLVQQKNVYASASIGNGNILFGGENGLSITNISDSTNTQKLASSFNIPTFESSNELFKRVDGKELYKSNDGNATQPEKSKIYSILQVDDGILVGGSFASVNGVEKHNLVKLNFDGTVNNEFKSDVGGSVYKIIKNKSNLYVTGVIGSYNDKEAYSVVQLDLNGKINEGFLPLKDYMFAKINDIAILDNEYLVLAGTFVKEASESDQNKTQEELLNLTTTVLVVDRKGNINTELSTKFSKIKNEVFALDISDDRLYIAGDFDFTEDNQKYNNLVAFDLDGNFDKDFKIEKLHGMIFDIEVLGNKIIFGGDFLVDNDDSTRSFYIVNKSGETIKIDNFSTDADIYNIDTYKGSIILSGEGEFTIKDKNFENLIILNLND